MKTMLKAIVCGIAIVTMSLIFAFGFDVMWMIWLLWPGILFNRLVFRNYHAEPHMVGWPSSLEIITIMAVSFVVYSVIAAFLFWYSGKRNLRSQS
jgi:hypothetical protein